MVQNKHRNRNSSYALLPKTQLISTSCLHITHCKTIKHYLRQPSKPSFSEEKLQKLAILIHLVAAEQWRWWIWIRIFGILQLL